MHKSPRESEQRKRSGEITGGLILLVAGTAVFGQQQCMRREVQQVLTENSPKPLMPSVPVSARPLKAITPKLYPIRRPLLVSPESITEALTLPPEQDIFQELQRCEQEWTDQSLRIWRSCKIYDCTPSCTENSPAYECQIASEDPTLKGTRVYLSLDLDDSAVTVSWSPDTLNGPMIVFPNPNFCEELEQYERERQTIREKIINYLKHFSLIAPISTTDGRIKFTLWDDAPCDGTFFPPDGRLTIEPSFTTVVFYNRDSEVSDADTHKLEVVSPPQLHDRIAFFLEEKQGFAASPCR